MLMIFVSHFSSDGATILMGERSTYAMIPVELFDLLCMEDGR